MDGKGWHEEGDMPDKIKGLLMGSIFENNKEIYINLIGLDQPLQSIF
jgi:hypothetical protein